MVNNWLDIIQDKLFPPSCILCGQAGVGGMDLCQDCFTELPKNLNCCYRCAEPFATVSQIPRLCGHCLSSPPAFDETVAPFLYSGSVSHLITGLKFAKQYKNARVLGILLAEYLASHTEMPDCIVPVPLHKQRYRQRGFNQAIEVANTVSNRLKIPLDLYDCIRQKNTAHQTRLPAKQRRKNVRKAFAANKPIGYRHVALLDDVMTTGSTASELAKTLKQAGVERVDVWVCARA